MPGHGGNTQILICSGQHTAVSGQKRIIRLNAYFIKIVKTFPHHTSVEKQIKNENGKN